MGYSGYALDTNPLLQYRGGRRVVSRSDRGAADAAAGRRDAPGCLGGAGFGLVGASFWEYGDVDAVGPYDESMVSVLVQDDDPEDAGFTPLFIIEISVDSKAAQWAGSQIGLDKILGHTHCKYVRPKGIKCMAEADDKLVMKATIDTANPDQMPLARVVALGVRDGLLVHTPVEYAGYVNYNDEPAKFRFGEHPLAQQLAKAGIGAIPSIESDWGTGLSSLLEKGHCTPL